MRTYTHIYKYAYTVYTYIHTQKGRKEYGHRLFWDLSRKVHSLILILKLEK